MQSDPITCIHRSTLGVALGDAAICADCRDDTATYGAQDAAADYLARVSASRRPSAKRRPVQLQRRHG